MSINPESHSNEIGTISNIISHSSFTRHSELRTGNSKRCAGGERHQSLKEKSVTLLVFDLMNNGISILFDMSAHTIRYANGAHCSSCNSFTPIFTTSHKSVFYFLSQTRSALHKNSLIYILLDYIYKILINYFITEGLYRPILILSWIVQLPYLLKDKMLLLS